MRTREITSLNNPAFRIYSQILSGRGLKKHGLTIMSGLKQVREVVRDFPDKLEAVLTAGPGRLPFGVPEGTALTRLDKELFDQLDLYGTGPPLAIIRVEPLLPWDDRNWPPGCSLFIPFQDPGNVGAVIRTAVAFEVPRIVLLKEAAHPFHHRTLRAAGTAAFTIPMFQGPSLRDLEEVETPLLTLDRGGQDIGGFRFPETFGLLPGLEGTGLPAGLKRLKALSIPVSPRVESLNAAMAVGLALYEWRRGKTSPGG